VFTAHVVEVAITSPVDSARLRAVIEHALDAWNSQHGRRRHILLVSSGRAVERCDVFIAIVDPTLPNSTAAISNVLHIKRSGKFILACLLAEPPAPDVGSDGSYQTSDAAQQLSRAGIVPRFVGAGDFLVESRLRAAVDADLTTIALAELTAKFDRVEQAPEVLASEVPAELLGPGIWAVTVHNRGASLVTGLTVSVEAVDAHGKVVPDGVTRSRQTIAASEFFAALRTNPWPVSPATPSAPGIVADNRERTFLAERVDVLAAHTALTFPQWLRSGQHTSALYSVVAHTHPRVRIEYHDDAGIRWSRIDSAEPQRVSSSAPLTRTERSDTVISR
jgi:hypothetical protein